VPASGAGLADDRWTQPAGTAGEGQHSAAERGAAAKGNTQHESDVEVTGHLAVGSMSSLRTLEQRLDAL
jgi:hypothetical protein